MKTSDIATLIGVHPQTIRRWTNRGKLTCSRTLGNHRRFSPPSNENKQVIGYARVSSADQKEDFVRQADTLRSHPVVEGYSMLNPEGALRSKASNFCFWKAWSMSRSLVTEVLIFSCVSNIFAVSCFCSANSRLYNSTPQK